MDPSDRRAFICLLCNARAPTISLWMSYLRQVHQSDSDKSISCPVPECGATYSNVNSICSHMYRTHKDVTSQPILTTSVHANPDVHALESVSDHELFDFTVPESLSHDINLLLHRGVHEQQKKSSLFLMQLKEERMLTQAAVNDIVSDFSEVFTHTVQHLKAGVSQKLVQFGIDLKDVDGLDGVFDVSDPFSGLESAYLQDKFISKELNCILSFH